MHGWPLSDDRHLRELEVNASRLCEQSMTRSPAENISRLRITRVPVGMIAVFPVASDRLPDYQLLLQISEDANAKSVPIEELVDTVRERIARD